MADEQEKILLIANTIDPGHKLDWLWSKCPCCVKGKFESAHIDKTNILDVEAWLLGKERNYPPNIGKQHPLKTGGVKLIKHIEWHTKTSLNPSEHIPARVTDSIHIIAAAIAASKKKECDASYKNDSPSEGKRSQG